MDEFVNHRMPKYLLLFWLLLFLLAAALSWFGADALAETFLLQQLPYLEETAASYGIHAGVPTELIPGYEKLHHTLFFVLLAVSGAFCLIGSLLSLLPLFRLYRQLNAIRGECYAVAEQLKTTVSLHGEDFSSVRRICEGINLIAGRMHTSLSHLAKERAELKDFLTDFSHQLKTSLAVIRLNSDMLAELDGLSAAQKQQLSDEISLHLDSMQELVVSALKLARLGADAVMYRMEAVPLSETCTCAVQHLQPLLQQAGITVEQRFQEGDVLSHDNIWLKEAIGNLLKNAVDHAECSSILLETQVLPACVKLIVEDNGRGMEQKEIPHLFDRFGKRSRCSGMQNAGVGLAIAKAIIEAHNGEIAVYSKSGMGTRFEILFLS